MDGPTPPYEVLKAQFDEFRKAEGLSPHQPTEPIGWRVIITDSETESGVAPVCPQPDVHAAMHGGTPGDPFVYDECCIGPHLEAFGESQAKDLCTVMNIIHVKVCD